VHLIDAPRTIVAQERSSFDGIGQFGERYAPAAQATLYDVDRFLALMV